MSSQVVSSLFLMVVCLTALVDVGMGCDPQTWKSDSRDCSVYYRCIGNVDYKFSCPISYVADVTQRRCVPEGTQNDICSTKKQTASAMKNGCKAGEKSAHEKTCEKYYECMENENGGTRLTPRECPYPQLFDTTAQKCIHYEIAKCGNLHVPIDACDYEINSCKSAHCVPCHVRFPSCAGLSDGLNSWTGREWSPYYVICHAQRVLYQGECRHDKEVQIFHPDLKMCVDYKDNRWNL